MLSTIASLRVNSAKQLDAQRDRPFAEFTLSEANGLRVTGILSKCLSFSYLFTRDFLPGKVRCEVLREGWIML